MALLLPALSRNKSVAQRTQCLGNVRQINLAIHMYVDDHGDQIADYTNDLYYACKDLLLSYFGQAAGATFSNHVFSCPADTSLYALPLTHYSSYGFNGVARATNDFGMARHRFAAVNDPAKTALTGEISGGIGISWHAPRSVGQYRDAPNVGGVADGHAANVKIYWSGATGVNGFPFFYEPVPGYQ